MGPAESVLAASVARRHFMLGQSKIEIAERLGLNRFKVARLIEAARDGGMVRIEICSTGEVDLDLSARLKDALNLNHCAVVAGHDGSGPDGNAARGKVAADLLAEILTDGDVLGLPWSRSVLAMTEALTSLPAVRVVQLSGAQENEGVDATAVDIVRATARVSEGESVIFHAPFMLDDREAATSIRRQATVAQALAATASVTHAVVGIGAWAAASSTIFDLASPAEREAAARAGAVGESAGVFFDVRGNCLEVTLTERMITLSGLRLHAIPEVIAIAGGADKAIAMRAAARGGLVNSVIVDTALARAVLADTEEGVSE